MAPAPAKIRTLRLDIPDIGVTMRFETPGIFSHNSFAIDLVRFQNKFNFGTKYG